KRMAQQVDTVQVFSNLSAAQLVEQALQRGERHLTHTGALLAVTCARTGRSPADRFVVDEPSTADSIEWGSVTRPFPADKFDVLWSRVEDYVDSCDSFVQQLHVGQDEDHYIPVNVTTQTAWHNLFGRNIFIRAEKYNPKGKEEWRILQ